MRKAALILSLCFCLAPMALAENLVTSGSMQVDLDNPPENITTHATPTVPRSNILVNPGFETGELDPWTTNNWTVTNNDAHSGVYSAFDVGNYWIRQDFAPIDVNQITSISTWHRQPDIAISAIDFFYSSTDYDEFLVFLSTPNWEFFDVTSQLRPSGMLQAIRIYGYSGGGSQQTYLDDITIETEGGTPASEGTWGQIKALFR